MTDKHAQNPIADDLRSTGDARQVVGTAPDIETTVQPSLGDPENAPGKRARAKVVPPPEVAGAEPAEDVETAVSDLDRPA